MTCNTIRYGALDNEIWIRSNNALGGATFSTRKHGGIAIEMIEKALEFFSMATFGNLGNSVTFCLFQFIV